MIPDEEDWNINKLRFFMIAYLWTETAIATYIMMRQRKHVDLTVGSMPPRLRPYKSLYNYETYHLAAFEMKDSMWVDIKLKFYSSAFSTVVIASDVIPLICENMTLFGTPFDFTPNFLSPEVKKDICFGFCWAFFQRTTGELVPGFIKRKFRVSFGHDKRGTVYFIRDLFDHTWMEIISRTGETFVVSLMAQHFGKHSPDRASQLLPLLLLYCLWSFVLMIVEDLLITILPEVDVIPMIEVKDRKKWVEPAERICAQSRYQIKDVVVLMADEQEEPNACCLSIFGLYTKIEIQSTLIEDLNNKTETWERMRRIRKTRRGQGLNPFEFEGTLGHEIGHWYHDHSAQIYLFLVLQKFIVFGLGLVLTEYKFLYDVFHFAPKEEGTPLHFEPGIDVSKYFVMQALETLGSWLFGLMRGRQEVQADAYSTIDMKQGKNNKQGLVKLYADVIDYPTSDPVFNIFYDSYPTLIQRLEGIDAAPP